eukprot:4803821-Pleurochrysis_carterae.AAC.1
MSDLGFSSRPAPPLAGDERVTRRSVTRGGDGGAALAPALARSVRAASAPLAAVLAGTPNSARMAFAP